MDCQVLFRKYANYTLNGELILNFTNTLETRFFGFVESLFKLILYMYNTLSHFSDHYVSTGYYQHIKLLYKNIFTQQITIIDVIYNKYKVIDQFIISNYTKNTNKLKIIGIKSDGKISLLINIQRMG